MNGARLRTRLFVKRMGGGGGGLSLQLGQGFNVSESEGGCVSHKVAMRFYGEGLVCDPHAAVVVCVLVVVLHCTYSRPMLAQTRQ